MKKKTSLPEDFSDLIERLGVEEIKAVFRDCDVNARGGYGKQTALAFSMLPAEIAVWLVENGADLSQPTSGETLRSTLALAANDQTLKFSSI